MTAVPDEIGDAPGTTPPTGVTGHGGPHDVRADDLIVRVSDRDLAGFSRHGTHLRAELEIHQPRGLIDRVWRALIGVPIPTEHERDERLSKTNALAVFSSDALSSVAYAPQAVLLTLLAAGTGAVAWSWPISLAVVALLAIVATSYRQTIYAYPLGGGSYTVARENLGMMPGLAAAAALSAGYILTVSVSIAAGVDALISAAQPLAPYRVWLAVAAVLLVTLANLRGIRESGSVFAVPTYAFLVAMFGLIGGGLYLYATGRLHASPPADLLSTTPEAFGLLLLLRAFSVGSAVMTGTEAISNGVPAFQPPEPRNAARTLVMMAAILGLMFLGLSFLILHSGALPSERETTMSQVARAVFGDGPLYYAVQASTALILLLAANTAFADFPRLGSLLARDDHAPHQLAYRGERLAFSNGIVLLGLLASVLLVLFGGRTEALLPLYAAGVFLAFTLSQTGMIVHWWRVRGLGWQFKAGVNGVGAAITAIVTITATITHFVDVQYPIVPGKPFGWWGAWLVLVVVPAFMWFFTQVHQHYKETRDDVALPPEPEPPRRYRHTVVVPVSELNRPTVSALGYARALSPNVLAVHIAADPAKSEELEAAWETWGLGMRLVVVDSPYRALTRPLLHFLMEHKRVERADIVTVVVPEYVPDSWWEHLLHNQSALRLKATLLFAPGFVVVSVPFHERRVAT